jgi:hydroxypyruvate reductase
VRASRLVERAIAAPGALPTASFRVICAGKAATSMGSAFARLHGPRIRQALVVGAAPPEMPAVFESIPGGHPVPTEASERAGRRALAVAASVSPDETLLVLLSGGASAMMAVPADGITLDDKRRTTDRLLKAGADIYALNTVRKHISAVKGGWLAAYASGPSRTFAISDVVGDDLSVIASGPTVADPSTFDDALNVLRRFGGVDTYPASVGARLSAGLRGAVAETPKPHDPRLARAVSSVIGGRREAMDAAVAEAAARGYQVVQIDEAVIGEARTASMTHLRAVMTRAAGVGRPACFVSSGETTVHVTGRGKGGRNQEFALAAAGLLASLETPAVVASVGTDGIDGPTDAAGALADSTTTSRALAAGIGAPERYLADNDAYAFFAALGDLIQTGPTDTNVGDLQIILFG